MAMEMETITLETVMVTTMETRIPEVSMEMRMEIVSSLSIKIKNS